MPLINNNMGNCFQETDRQLVTSTGSSYSSKDTVMAEMVKMTEVEHKRQTIINKLLTDKRLYFTLGGEKSLYKKVLE
jgi:hypothetical protein